MKRDPLFFQRRKRPGSRQVQLALALPEEHRLALVRIDLNDRRLEPRDPFAEFRESTRLPAIFDSMRGTTKLVKRMPELRDSFTAVKTKQGFGP